MPCFAFEFFDSDRLSLSNYLIPAEEGCSWQVMFPKGLKLADLLSLRFWVISLLNMPLELVPVPVGMRTSVALRWRRVFPFLFGCCFSLHFLVQLLHKLFFSDLHLK